jgi:hypothetical protein
MTNRNIKNDITFIDTETFEPRCTYNGCAEKFEIKKRDKKVIHYPNKKQRREITYQEQYRQCSECGQKVTLNVDVRASNSNKAKEIVKTADKNTKTEKIS